MKFERLCEKIVLMLGLLFFLPLTYYSMRYTVWCRDITEIVQDYQDSVLGNLIGLLIFMILMIIVRIMVKKIGRKTALRIMMIFTLLYVVLIGTIWVAVASIRPVADPEAICQVAQLMLNGNYETLIPPGYMSYNPQQFGLVMVLQMLFRMFGEGNYVSFEYLNVFCLPLLIYAGHKILEIIFENELINIYYFILIIFCMPLMFYTTYIYGEIISITFCMVLMWHTIRFCRKATVRDALWMIGAAVVANIVRMNSLIVVCAVVIVLMVHGISNRRWQVLFVCLGMIGSIFVTNGAIKAYYAEKSGIEIRKGIPHISYILMGLEESEFGPGWFNGTNYTELEACDYDSERAAESSRIKIQTRLTEMGNEPGKAVTFFKRKVLTQWNCPDYNAYFATGNFECAEEELPTYVYNIYRGNMRGHIERFMDRYQFVIYFNCMCCIIGLFWRKKPIENQILLIAIIGGFMFSILWEAKSRYVLPYMIFSLPLAAGGVYWLQEYIKSISKYRKTAKQQIK